MHLVQVEEKWRKYATRVEHSFLTTSGPSPQLMLFISQPIILNNTAWAFSSLKDCLFECYQNEQGTARGLTYESVFNLTVKVRAPKNFTFSESFANRLLAICHPWGERWSLVSVSWILAILAGGPGWYSCNTSWESQYTSCQEKWYELARASLMW